MSVVYILVTASVHAIAVQGYASEVMAEAAAQRWLEAATVGHRRFMDDPALSLASRLGRWNDYVCALPRSHKAYRRTCNVVACDVEEDACPTRATS